MRLGRGREAVTATRWLVVGNGSLPLSNRCESRDNSFRCVGEEGHHGCHWAPLVGDKAFRWGMRGWGCFDPICVKRPGHPMPHNDGRGTTWWPPEMADRWENP